jgi:exopolysaccharide biosynthesis protein
VPAGILLLVALGILARPHGLAGRLGARYVIIDLAGGGYRVSPELARGVHGTEEFASMMDRMEPVAAISGTYHDPDSRPLGDIVMDGKIVRRGCQRQGIGFTSSGQVRFLERKGRSRIDWRGCSSGIACGPRLVRAGRVDINVQRDGFGPAAATNVASRCAVGATSDGKLILCVISKPIDLDTLALVMLELGARDAINMDGGSMCALYANGRLRVEPVMPVSNVLVVHAKK